MKRLPRRFPPALLPHVLDSALVLGLTLGLSACSSDAAVSGTGSPAGSTPSTASGSTPVSAPVSTPSSASGSAAVSAPPVQAAFSYNLGSTAQINAGATPAGQVVSLDLLEVDAAQPARLRAAGRYVICYFSAGSSEKFRTDADSVALQQGSLNLGTLDGWPDERWLDIRGFGETSSARLDTIRRVMDDRLDLARSKGCQAAEFDNVEAWNNPVNIGVSGVAVHAISAADQLAYNRWLAQEARSRGVAALLKNDLDQISALLPDFDGAVNEQCFDYDECARLDPFRDAGKAIYVVEYQPASWVTAARRALAATHHLNTTLTDLNVTQLDPYATFGSW